MSELPWLRLYSSIVDDEKIRLLAFEDRWHYVALLCLKSQGVLDSNPALLDRKVAVKLGVQVRDLEEVKRRLIEVELIDENYQPCGWEIRQRKSDSSTDRTRKYRERKKKIVCDGNETSQERHGDALEEDTDTDTEKDSIDTNVSIVGNDESIPDCPHRVIIELFAKHCPEAIQPRSWDGARMTALKARWRESTDRQNPSWWAKFFGYIHKSDFLMGRTYSRGNDPFQLSLDWVVTKRNFDKIIDGKYENR